MSPRLDRGDKWWRMGGVKPVGTRPSIAGRPLVCNASAPRRLARLGRLQTREEALEGRDPLLEQVALRRTAGRLKLGGGVGQGQRHRFSPFAAVALLGRQGRSGRAAGAPVFLLRFDRLALPAARHDPA